MQERKQTRRTDKPMGPTGADKGAQFLSITPCFPSKQAPVSRSSHCYPLVLPSECQNVGTPRMMVRLAELGGHGREWRRRAILQGTDVTLVSPRKALSGKGAAVGTKDRVLRYSKQHLVFFFRLMLQMDGLFQ